MPHFTKTLATRLSAAEIKDKMDGAVKRVDEGDMYEASKLMCDVSKSILCFGSPPEEAIDLLKPDVIKVLKALAECSDIFADYDAFRAFNIPEIEKSSIKETSRKYLRRSEY